MVATHLVKKKCFESSLIFLNHEKTINLLKSMKIKFFNKIGYKQGWHSFSQKIIILSEKKTALSHSEF